MKIKDLIFLVALCVCLPDSAWADEVPEKYRDTVSKGLEYLVKHQHKDGHWEGDEGKHPTAMTTLVGMALLMEGSNVEKGKYADAIRKAADWLMDKSQGRGGLIFSGHPSETDRYMYGHGLAVQFLSWAHGANRSEKVRTILTAADEYIGKAQSSQGGWYRTSRAEGHDFDELTATVIQVQALYMCRAYAGDYTDTGAGQEYLRLALRKYEKDPKTSRDLQAVETALALACRCNWDQSFSNESTKEWLKLCQTEISSDIQFGRDELTHYYYAQVLFNKLLNAGGAADWEKYRTAVFDKLQSRQSKDGRWPGGNGIGVGPLYSTAVWCTVLQMDKRCHPLLQKPLAFGSGFFH
jgi:hypothetical protein